MHILTDPILASLISIAAAFGLAVLAFWISKPRFIMSRHSKDPDRLELQWSRVICYSLLIASVLGVVVLVVLIEVHKKIPGTRYHRAANRG